MTLKLKQNDNGIQKHHPRDKLRGSCVMLGQSSSPCWGGENQDRCPKERVSISGSGPTECWGSGVEIHFPAEGTCYWAVLP